MQTTARDHWASAEAEAFCAENRRFDDINARFQAAINLQTNFMIVYCLFKKQPAIGVNFTNDDN